MEEVDMNVSFEEISELFDSGSLQLPVGLGVTVFGDTLTEAVLDSHSNWPSS